MLATLAWFSPFINGLVFAVGVPGNILVLGVLADKRAVHRPVVRMLLAFLAASDLAVCLCRMVAVYISLADEAALVPGVRNTLSTARCRVSDTSLYLSIYTSLLVIPAATVCQHRYLTVTSPFGEETPDTAIKRWVMYIAACAVCSLAMAGLLPFVGDYELSTNDVWYPCETTSPAWLVELRLYTLVSLSVVAFVIIIYFFAAIVQAQRRKGTAKVGAEKQSCLRPITSAIGISFVYPQRPDVMGTLPPPPLDPSDPRTTFGGISSSTPESPTTINPAKSPDPALDSTRQQDVKTSLESGDMRDDGVVLRCPAEPIQLAHLLTNRPPSLPSPPSRGRFRSRAPSAADPSQMVLSKALMFLLTWTPVLIGRLVGWPINPAGSVERANVWAEICLSLTLLNPASNVLLFSLASSEFRKECKTLVTRVRCFWEPKIAQGTIISRRTRYWFQ